MKFKKGDKVICVDNSGDDDFLTLGKEYVISSANDNFVFVIASNSSGGRFYHERFELAEDTSNYITTKDFIKEVEKLGYVVEENETYLHLYSDYYHQGYSNYWIEVYKYELNQISTAIVGDVPTETFDLIIKYAKTPIKFREEPKKYTLELPNTTIKARYFRFGLPHAKHSYKFGALPKSTTNSDIDYQAYFTQQEIDNLPNQEFIAQLRKEEIEC